MTEKKEYQPEIFPNHPMDATDFREWEKNLAQVGDMVDFGYELRPIVGFYENDQGKWAIIKRKNSFGKYGEKLADIVTRNKTGTLNDQSENN